MDLTQAELARQVGCVAGTIKSIEADLRRPSKQLAERLAQVLALEPETRAIFLKAARSELAVSQLQPLPTAVSASGERTSTPPVSRLVHHHLRAPVSDFCGRGLDLDRLQAVLDLAAGADGGAAVAGISGMGGIGKTELAYAVAARVQGAYPDGLLLLDLDGTSTAPLTSTQALQQIIRSFWPEGQLPEEPAAIQQLYRSTLAGRRVLILADDASDAVQVRPLLPPAGSALLITSRQRFALDGMTVVHLERLVEEEAVQLLRGICARLDEQQARLIADRCGGLPLALRVSGGILLNDPALTPERYLAQLTDQCLASLRDPDDPERDVAAVLRLSYAALEPPLQMRFCQLGVLAAEADLALVASVLELSEEAADAALRTLLRRCLVEYDPVQNRWRLHDLVRACALAWLRELADERAARLRYARRVIATVQQIDECLQIWASREVWDDKLAALMQFDRMRAHLDAVRVWLWGQPPEPDIDALLIAEAHATRNVGEIRDPLRAVRVPQQERALVAAQRRNDLPAQACFLGNLGGALRLLGDLRGAFSAYQRWLTYARAAGDRHEEQRALDQLGHAYADLGQPDKALECHEQALALAREIGDPQGECYTLSSLGSTYQELGELPIAVGYTEQSLAMACDRGDLRGESRALTLLGRIALFRGEVHGAIDYHQRHLVLARAAGDRRAEGRALSNLGATWIDLGQIPIAISYLEQSLTIAREIGDRNGEGQVLGRMGDAAVERGDLPAAIAYQEQHLAIVRETGDRPFEGWRLSRLGAAYAAAGQIAAALQAIGSAKVIAGEIRDRMLEGWVLGTLAGIQTFQGQHSEANITYQQAIDLLDRQGYTRGLVRTRWAYGQFLVRQGDREQGIALMAECVAYEQRIGHAKADEHAALVDSLRAGGSL
jgi:tetratricopeptide (TPR) repeat protein/DNA-binding XRE family transcriptional regulator